MENSKPSIDKEEAGDKTLYTVEASDAEGDTIYFQLTGTDANKFTLSSSGVLAFKEVPDYENPTDEDNDNVYDINISVTDIEPTSSTLKLSGKQVTLSLFLC